MKGIAVGIPLKAEMYSRFDDKADIKVVARLKVFFPPLGWYQFVLVILHYVYCIDYMVNIFKGNIGAPGQSELFQSSAYFP